MDNNIHLERVQRYFDQGWYNKVIEYTDKLINIGAIESELWNLRGISFSNLGQNEEAVECFDKSIELDYNNNILWNNKGDSLLELGRFMEGLKCYDKSLEINPTHVYTLMAKGSALFHLGKFEESFEYFDKCTNLDPNNDIGWCNKGSALLNLGKFRGAIKCFNKSIEMNPTDVESLNSKGVALFNLGKLKEAIDSYELALELDPTNDTIRDNKIFAQNALENEESGLEDIVEGFESNYKCSKCGFENLEGSIFCSGCGQNLNIKVICDKCGVENLESAKFCHGCGENLEKAEFSNGSDALIKNESSNLNYQSGGFVLGSGLDALIRKEKPQNEYNDSLEKVKKVDINNDSEDKIASLPNLGIVLAKRVIQIRDSQGGFESLEDFFSLMELKPHVVKNIEGLIVCGPIKKSRKPKKIHTWGRPVEVVEEVKVVDVNNDSKEKITSLPGIGVVLTKKVIDLRESSGGFESLEDFFSLMELKPHVVKNIEGLIVCGPIKKSRKLKKIHTRGRSVEK